MKKNNKPMILAMLICFILISIFIPEVAENTAFAADEPSDLREADADEAYAVFNSSDGSLKLFRGESGLYNDGQIIGDLTYYAGIESVTGNTMPKWSDKAALIKSFSIEAGDVIRPLTCHCWFYNCTELTDVELTGLDTSETKSMKYMFNNCSNLESPDLSGLVTSEVTDMTGMFGNCNKLTNCDLSGFDTSKVYSMYRMFYNCSSLVSLDISGFDTSVIPDETYMFYNCTSLMFIRLGPDFRFLTSCNIKTPFQRVEAHGNQAITSDPVYYNFADYQGDYPGLYRIGCKAMAVFDSSDGSLIFTEDDRSEHLNKKEVIGTKTYYTGIMNTGAANPPWYENNKLIKNVSFTRDISPLSCNRWFQNCSNLGVCDMQKLDTSRSTRFNSMFSGCSGLYRIALGEKTLITSNPPNSGWKRYRLLNGNSTDGPEITNLSNYDGTSPGWYSLEGSDICAVYDSDDGSLVFFKDESGDIFNGQVTGTKTYYTNFASGGSVPWEDKKSSIRVIGFSERIKPRSIANWFSGCSMISELDLTNLVIPAAQNNALKGCVSLKKLKVGHSESGIYINDDSMLSGIWRNGETNEECRLEVNGSRTSGMLSEGVWELVTEIYVTVSIDRSAIDHPSLNDGQIIKMFHTRDGASPEGDAVRQFDSGNDALSFSDERCMYVSNQGNIEYYDYSFYADDDALSITWDIIPDGKKSSIKYELVIRNCRITYITGKINWEGDRPEDRPEKVTVELMRNGTLYEEQDVSKDEDWKYSFAVPTADERGVIYEYEVKEKPVEDYVINCEKYDGMRFVFEKTENIIPYFIFRHNGIWYMAEADFKGGILTIPGDAFYLPIQSCPVSLSYAEHIKLGDEIKNAAESWADYPFNTEIAIDDLLSGSDLVDGAETGSIIPLTDSDSDLVNILADDIYYGSDAWMYTLTEPYPLYVPDNEGVVLCGVSGTSSITNTSIRGVKDICGKKIWDSHDHPDEITVVVEQNGSEAGRKKISEGTGWEYSFTGMPIFDDEGNEIVYTVKEVPVKGYKMTRETKPAECLDKAVKVSYTVDSGASAGALEGGFFVAYDRDGKAYKYQPEGMADDGEHVIVFPAMDFDLVFRGSDNVMRGSKRNTSGYPIEVTNAEIIDSPYDYIPGSAFTDNALGNSWTASDITGEDLPYPDRTRLYHYGADENAALAFIYYGKLNIIPYTIQAESPWEDLINEYKEGKLTIRKTGENAEALQGAEFGLYFTENSSTDEDWTKTEETPTAYGTTNVNGELIFENIPYGCYLLEETKAPAGYKTAEAVKAIIDSDETDVSVCNEKTKIIISKVDQKGQLLEGAQLKILDGDGREVDSWISSGSTAHEVMGLTEGTEYVLKEEMPPEGYETADDISFIVQRGKDTEITMEDRKEIIPFPIPTGAKQAGALMSLVLLGFAAILLKCKIHKT